MIEQLINVIFWIHDLQRRTCDPVLNEYRGYQWRMVVSICGVVFFLLISWLFFPLEIANTGLEAILAVPLAYAELLFDFLIVAFCVVYLINAIQLWLFCKKYEI
jgi:hypothetical protein